MGQSWIAVASAEHVRIGVARGFMQVCHGKAGPLRRLSPGDRVAYYSPTGRYRGCDPCQAFTAMGVVAQGLPYQADMGGGFRPYRRAVAWVEAQDAPIRPLLGRLGFTRDRPSWGYLFRFGLFAIAEADMDLIKEAMAAMV